MRNGLFAVVIAGVAALLFAGCRDVGPLATREFAVDRVGAMISIPIDVIPGGQFNLKDTYVVALGFDAGSGKKAVDALFGSTPTASALRLRVNFVRTGGGWDEHVPFTATAFSRRINDGVLTNTYDGSRDQSVISLVRQRGIGKSEAHMEIARFRFPSFGSYRIDIETVEDQPVLRGVPTKVYVTVPFGHPK